MDYDVDVTLEETLTAARKDSNLSTSYLPATRKDSNSSTPYLPTARKDSNSSTSSLSFSFRSMFGRHDSDVSSVSSISTSELGTSDLGYEKDGEDSDISMDSIQELNSRDSRKKSSGSFQTKTRRISENSLPTVTESELDDVDWQRKASVSSYSQSSSPLLTSIAIADNHSPPESPVKEGRITRVKSKSLDSGEVSETALEKMHKLSRSGMVMLESSLNKLMNMKTGVVDGLRRRSEGGGLDISSLEDEFDCANMAKEVEPKLTVPEEFYTSLVQTCLHSLGRRETNGHNPVEMACHVQRIFRVPNSIHGEILKDQLNKAPESYLLRVTIIEARDIKPMDPNGLSDPYCILTICRSSASGRTSPNPMTQSHTLPEQNSPNNRRRFGASSPNNISSPSTSPQSVRKEKSPAKSPLASPTTSPISKRKDKSPSLARRHAVNNRSFRRRRKISDLGDHHSGVGGDVAARVRSNTDLISVPSSPRSPRIRSISRIMDSESLIKTMIKKETLHPVWNETFDLEVCDDKVDQLELRLTMWDWDEDTSVYEAFKSVESGHKVAGIKNLFRHVKGGTKNTDDFMGTVIIPLSDIPNATRVDKWYTIQRSHAKHLSRDVGKVHLKLNFLKKQKSNDLDDATKLDYYQQLATALYKHDGEKHLKDNTGLPWDGKLSELSQMLLNDYAVHNGVAKLSQQILNLSGLLSFHHENSMAKKKPSPVLVSQQCVDEPDGADTSHDQSSYQQNRSNSAPQSSQIRTDVETPAMDENETSYSRSQSSNPDLPTQMSPRRTGRSLITDMDPVLYDRAIREATYNVHAEIIAMTNVSMYEGKTIAEMSENNPDFLVYEMGFAEVSVCSYIDLCFRNIADLPLLFPATGLETLESLNIKCRLQNIHTLLSMKIWRSTETTPHRLVKNTLTTVIRANVGAWLNDRFAQFPKMGEIVTPHMLVSLLDKLSETLVELCDVCKQNKDYKNFFMRYNVEYYTAVAHQVDQEISHCIKDALDKLSHYQIQYQKYPENISESSKASLKLYMRVKRMALALRNVVSYRDVLEIYQFHTWFQEPLIFWLVTFKQETFGRVQRALEMDKDVVLVHQVVKYSNSAVDVQACFAKVTEEWGSIGFEGPHPRCVAITKLTELICEGARLYANKVHWILEENGFYKEDIETKFDIKDKLCITLNNIEHVRTYLDNLPQLLQWDTNVKDLTTEHDDPSAGKRTLDTLHRLTTMASKDVLMKSSTVEKKIADRMCSEVSKFMENVVNPCATCDEDYLDELMGYIDQQLETLYKQLLPQIFPRIVEDLWKEILSRISSLMQSGKPPVYYHELGGSLKTLENYFQRPGINLPSNQVKTKEYIFLDKHLQLNSLTTHELMLEYYRTTAAEVATSEEYLGHVGIKMVVGNETSLDDNLDATKTISIKVCNAVDLPGMDRSGSSDPYVIVQVLPETSLAKRIVYQTQVKGQTLNAKFNETFKFDNIPVSIIESGAVIGLTIMDHDFIVADDFIGEVFYPLKLAQVIGGLQTVDNASVVMLPIRRPHVMNSKEFQVLRDRSRWDHKAKQFLSQRTRAIVKQKKRTDKPNNKTHNVFAAVGKTLLSFCSLACQLDDDDGH